MEKDVSLMSEPPWEFDDPKIADDDVLYRRAPLHDSSADRFPRGTVPDVGKDGHSPKLGAVDLQWDPTGISVSRRGLMKIHGISENQVITAKQNHLFAISVADIRSCEPVDGFYLGVLDSPAGGLSDDPNWEFIAKVHSSILSSQRTLPKPIWRKLRTRIIDKFEWHDLDA
ncbi:hypothetical protein ACIBFB_13460 [Nocardiopsis sp. NPDC050513]|uniref:hypothetical protein n=1 Tax=Nocardiopsis sp. NPDC050513 TaxID=3364338 RepID=UPI00379ABAFD